jgi:hypothetical protein
MFTQKIPKEVSQKIAQCSNIPRKISQKYPRKVPEIFPRKPCGHRPNQKKFLKEASALFPKIPKNRVSNGAQKASQQKHPKPQESSNIEPSGDRIGRVEPGSMDLIQGLLRISSLAACQKLLMLTRSLDASCKQTTHLVFPIPCGSGAKMSKYR